MGLAGFAVPGAQPVLAFVLVTMPGAQLTVPSGAGVAPGVAFAGVVATAPGAGAVVTPVVPVGEFTSGVVLW